MPIKVFFPFFFFNEIDARKLVDCFVLKPMLIMEVLTLISYIISAET
jgi:hypothetical protein